MASIVLVHGAFGGSYGFRKLRPLLSAQGHDVFTPSLTGIGERSHLRAWGDRVDLSLHIQDVHNTIYYEDLHDIVLLGFSYGGMVVTGLLNAMANRVAHLVYLDAFVPNDRQSAVDVLGAGGPGFIGRATDEGVPPIPRELETPEATAWGEARRVHQPVATLTEPVRLSVPLEEHSFSRTFIKASADANEPRDSPFWQAADHASASDNWSFHEVETNHMIPENRPDELAAILLDLLASAEQWATIAAEGLHRGV